jgi:hypothetical protein
MAVTEGLAQSICAAVLIWGATKRRTDLQRPSGWFKLVDENPGASRVNAPILAPCPPIRGCVWLCEMSRVAR